MHFAVLTLVATLATHFQSVNYAPNPHFAFGSATPLAWTKVYTASGKLIVARDTNTFLNAPASLSLTGTDDTASGNVGADLPDVSGKTVFVAGSVRSAGSLRAAQVAMFFLDSSFKPIEYRPLVNQDVFHDGVWTPFRVVTTIPANAKYTSLLLMLAGRGTAWLGEISVSDTVPPTPPYLIPPKVAPTRRGPDSPKVVAVSAVAPDVLEVEIQAGHVTPAHLSLYHQQPGDQRAPQGTREILKRNGQEVGFLLGVNHDHLETYEGFVGDELQSEYASWAGSFSIRGDADPDYASPKRPVAVFRKSKPNDWQQTSPQNMAMDQRIYLELPHSLKQGHWYTVGLGDLNAQPNSVTFVFDPSKLMSEAVHVSQVGFRPDDPFKRAYLSCWRGTGGGQTYSLPMSFRVVNAVSGKTVYRGAVKLGWPASQPEHMQREENFIKADVYWMDFTPVSTPGTYRVVVDGIGCSFDFPIRRDVWDGAFKIQMRGLVNERSGIELKPPYADYVRPADQMPNPGQLVTESKFAMIDSPNTWPELAKGDTGKPVKGAHGGYHDAGDWNPRRVTHMKVTMAHLELLELFPRHFAALRLGLPDASNTPDVLQEALFELDLFRRLQKPDGGIPFGLETNGDPSYGDLSWLTTMHLYEFAPDSFGSWTYAGVAAQAARLLESYDPAKAKLYRESAVRAMRWAEAHYPEERSKLTWDNIDARNLAAVELYWLTGDTHWHQVFLENTLLTTPHPNLFQWGKAVQRDAAFVYARLPKGLGDPALKENAKDGLVAMAQKCLTYGNGNAFNITNCDKGRPFLGGFYSEEDASDLCRAHFLIGKPEYLAGLVRACGFPTGANPEDMTFTSGLGLNPVKHPLHLDSRGTGQPAPKGLTVYGPIDFVLFHDPGTIWPMTYYLNRLCVPPSSDWPIPEAYFDIFLYPMINEFTVDNWAGNVYAWGYLAGRP